MNSEKHIVFLQNLGNRIAELRRAQNLTKVQLAFEINTSEGYIRRIEKGEVNIGAITLYRIAETLNVPIASLFEI